MSYKSTVLETAGLVALWELGEAAGNAIEAKNGLNGTYKGAPVRAQPSLLPNGEGASVRLANANFIEVAHNALLNLANVFSIEAWIRVRTPTANNNILSKGAGAYHARVNAQDRVQLLRSGTAEMAKSSWRLSAHRPYHVVITKNGAARAIYINGVEVQEAEVDSVCANTATALLIGGADGATAGLFDGWMQYVALYSTAISQATAAAHYKAGEGTVPLPTGPNRGPILKLELPEIPEPLDDGIIVRNATSGAALMLNPLSGLAGFGAYPGDDLILDFERQTITNQKGEDRTSILTSGKPLMMDGVNGLWNRDPIVTDPSEIQVALLEAASSGSAWEKTARHSFGGAAEAITGKALDLGGYVWAALAGSDATDFLANGQRIATSDVATLPAGFEGRAIGIDNNMGAQRAFVVFNLSKIVTGQRLGLFARVKDANNFFGCYLEQQASGAFLLRVFKVKAGVTTFVDNGGVVWPYAELASPASTSRRLEMFLMDDYCRVMVAQAGTFPLSLFEVTDADLATTLALGDTYIYDENPTATARTVTYTFFEVQPYAGEPGVAGFEALSAKATLRWDKGYY